MNNCIDFSESRILLNTDKSEVLITMELFKMLFDWLYKFCEELLSWKQKML